MQIKEIHPRQASRYGAVFAVAWAGDVRPPLLPLKWDTGIAGSGDAIAWASDDNDLAWAA